MEEGEQVNVSTCVYVWFPRHTHRHTDTQTHRHTDTDTDTDIDIDTDIDTDIDHLCKEFDKTRQFNSIASGP